MMQIDLTPIPWATPTPYPTPEGTPVIDLSAAVDSAAFAENIVSGWQTFNNTGWLDVIFWALIVAIIVSGIVSVKRHLEDA